MKKYGSAKRILPIFMILLSVGSIAGCSLSSSDNAVSESREERVCDFYLATDEEAKDSPNIYLITKARNNVYWDSLIAGAVEGADSDGVNLYVGGITRESYVDDLRDLIHEAGDNKADAVIVSPQNTTDIIREINRLKEIGIPVIFVDSLLNETDFDICYMTDNMHAGSLAAKGILDSLRREGRGEEEELLVGIEVGSLQSQTIMERMAGFNGYWSKNAPGSWRIIENISCNDGDAAKAKQDADDYMDEYPNLAVLVGLNNGSTVGIANSVMDRARTDIVVVGFDYSDEIAAMIDDTRYNATTIVQRQYSMGMESVKEAGELIKGEKPEYKFVDTGVVLVSKDNVDDISVQKILTQ